MPRVSARVDTRIYAPCVYTRIHIVYTRARICMFIRHAIARVSLLSDTDTRHSWTPSKSYQTINPAHICPDYLCHSTTQNHTFVNKIIVEKRFDWQCQGDEARTDASKSCHCQNWDQNSTN